MQLKMNLPEEITNRTGAGSSAGPSTAAAPASSEGADSTAIPRLDWQFASFEVPQVPPAPRTLLSQDPGKIPKTRKSDLPVVRARLAQEEGQRRVKQLKKDGFDDEEAGLRLNALMRRRAKVRLQCALVYEDVVDAAKAVEMAHKAGPSADLLDKALDRFYRAESRFATLSDGYHGCTGVEVPRYCGIPPCALPDR